MALGRLALIAALASCVAHTGSADQPSRSDKGLEVHVVDERGAPLPGLKVEAAYRSNPGPIGSLCCFWTHLGEAITGADGIAWLPYPPASSGLQLSTERPGWPPQALSSTGLLGGDWGPGPPTLVLGPPRDLPGRVDLGDCTPGFAQVTVVPGPRGPVAPAVASVAADGRFVARGLGPGKHTVFLRACGREAHADVDAVGQPKEPLPTVVLPPRDPRRPRYPPPRKAPRSPQDLVPARRPPPAPCMPATGPLVVAGDFQTLALDERCRFVLAGRELIENRYEAASWTLVRPDGRTLPLGTSSRLPPALGERIAVLSPPGEHISIRVVDLAGGAREEIGPVGRFALGAADALVLGGTATTLPYNDKPLEIRWRDGRRQRLGERVADGWLLVGGKRWVVYGIRTGSGFSPTEVHALDLTTGKDRLLARDVTLTLSFEGRTDVVLGAGNRLLRWDLAAGDGEGHLLVEPASNWWPLGPDLLVKPEDPSRFRIWTRGQSRLLPFRLPWSSDVRKARVGADHLLLFADGDAVLVDLPAGDGRLVGEGISPTSTEALLLARGALVLNETFGRVLLAPLDGRPARALGVGIAHSVSPDGAWLAITQIAGAHIDLVPTDASGKSMPLTALGGTWLPDAPVFLHTGPTRYSDPRPLLAVYPAQQRTLTVEPRVLAYRPISAREVLVVVPPGGSRAAGIWRVPVI